jgi:hypothetical protein
MLRVFNWTILSHPPSVPNYLPLGAGGSDNYHSTLLLPPSRVADKQRPHFVVVHDSNPQFTTPTLVTECQPNYRQVIAWYQRLGLVLPSVITVVAKVSFTNHYGADSSSISVHYSSGSGAQAHLRSLQLPLRTLLFAPRGWWQR